MHFSYAWLIRQERALDLLRLAESYEIVPSLGISGTASTMIIFTLCANFYTVRQECLTWYHIDIESVVSHSVPKSVCPAVEEWDWVASIDRATSICVVVFSLKKCCIKMVVWGSLFQDWVSSLTTSVSFSPPITGANTWLKELVYNLKLWHASLSVCIYCLERQTSTVKTKLRTEVFKISRWTWQEEFFKICSTLQIILTGLPVRLLCTDLSTQCN